jgi:pyruvate dehydrogenase E1 component
MIVDGIHHGNGDSDADETREWLDSFTGVLQAQGTDRASYLLTQLKHKAFRSGVDIPFTANTPYINTIPRERQAPFPGSREIERRIKSLVRWNAMAMVVRANKNTPGIGGHISTYASAATLYEIGYNHFFRGPEAPGGADLVYFQGHASPGIYARAFVEGRLSAKHLENFRREMAEGGGLSSYPHPWLMPNFWQFPTVSMGLGPIMAIYQARYNRYLLHRGLKDTSQQRVWCFLGDGETDEPESLGALTLASREKLDNLIFVVNCNLQRLDGPVRGNGKIIQELEAAFRGAGWNVIKVIWSSAWRKSLTASFKNMASKHPATRASTSSESTPSWPSSSKTCRTTRSASYRAAATTRKKSSPPIMRRSTIPAARQSSWPRPSKVMAWARPAKAVTSPTRPRS